MILWECEGIYLKSGWMTPGFIEVDEDGMIKSISSSKPQGNYKSVEKVNGYIIAPFQNSHSHAFQYAMVGMSENLQMGKEDDDFWSWRSQMYNLALKISPNHLQNIAEILYCEMLRFGYTHVAEFHYLHHDQKGKKYAHISEHSERLMQAATNVGMRLTLIPMYYNKGGFNQEPSPDQRRFISSSPDDYYKLVESAKNDAKKYNMVNVGMGIHSLRASSQEDIKEIFSGKEDLYHLHIAEQTKEIEDCKKHWNKRSVEWLLDEVDLDDRFHLVHATHIEKIEIERLAKTGAHVVVCPTTEGNLGDGIFPLLDFQKAGGNYSIGSDSHICLNPLEELKLLDYSQRFILRKRNPLLTKGGEDSGELLYQKLGLVGRSLLVKK